MRAGVIATLVVAVVAWLLDAGLYMSILMPPQEFIDAMASVAHTEETMPGPHMWLFYEIPRVALMAFIVLQRPYSTGQSAMYGAFAFFLAWMVANVPMGMWINVPMDMGYMIMDLVGALVVGAVCGVLVTVLNKKLGGAS